MKYIREDGKELNITTILEDKENPTIFKHFKGHIVKIITIAKHSETEENMVVYTHDNDENVWARPINMFFSKVDKEKYPDVEQEYRFEIIEN